MIHKAHDDERAKLEKTHPELLEMRDAWLRAHPHRTLEHWIVATAIDAATKNWRLNIRGCMGNI